MQKYFILPVQDGVPAKFSKEGSPVNVDFNYSWHVCCYSRLQDEIAAEILVDF